MRHYMIELEIFEAMVGSYAPMALTQILPGKAFAPGCMGNTR